MPEHRTIKERLRQLYELAKRATNEGEKRNAVDALKRLLKKHGLTLKDIKDEELIKVEVKYTSALEKRLLQQCAHAVLNQYNLSFWPGKRSMIFEVTPIQAAELKDMFSYYRKALKKDINDLFLAFVSKHRIGCTSRPESSEPSKMSLEEIERMMRMMGGLGSERYMPRSRRIEDGKG